MTTSTKRLPLQFVSPGEYTTKGGKWTVKRMDGGSWTIFAANGDVAQTGLPSAMDCRRWLATNDPALIPSERAAAPAGDDAAAEMAAEMGVTPAAAPAPAAAAEPAAPAPARPDSRKGIEALMADLNRLFPERKEVVEGMMAAVLAGEHVCLLGPPGTGKSALVRAMAQAFGGSYFERLMTRFSTPEELFGPVSLRGLEQDRFERAIAGKLPTAQFAFVDEVFKSNSAILNSLLTVMNERLFHNDGAVIRCPLISLFGASNEMPESKELDALFDRFLVRFEVKYLLRDSAFKAMIQAAEPVAQVQLRMETLATAQAEVTAVRVTEATVDALIALRAALTAEQIVVSDRRWKRCLKLAQAMAWMAGDAETAPEHLAILTDALWREPKERTKVAKIVGQFTDSVASKANEIAAAAAEIATAVTSIGDRKALVAAAGKAMTDLRSMYRKLDSLARGAGRSGRTAIDTAKAEVTRVADDLKRHTAGAVGL